MAEMPWHETAPADIAPQKSWIALLGRRDFPVDGVEDYCTFLKEALARRGIALTAARVNWGDQGWFAALWQLRRESMAWRSRWVLMQYTALSWSRRGFSFLALAVVALLRRGNVRLAVVFHEPDRQGGSRWIDQIRGTCQTWVIRRLYQRAVKAIFTVPLETVRWLPRGDNKSEFIPIGANIPERLKRRLPPAPVGPKKTVLVFVVTGAPGTTREIEDIAYVVQEASKVLGSLRLVVVGRGAGEAKEQLEKALEGSKVELVVRGVLPAAQIAEEFDSAHALLFIRSPINHRRGSALAGIATGIPIVGYGDENTVGPVKDSGVEWSPWPDREGLVRGVIRVLSDPQRWLYLHERNLQVQKDHLSWSRIAERYGATLDE